MEPIAEKKKLVLESALELIRENGFHGTPMSRVAKQAGVAAGTIYTYFESKDELILDLYQYVKTNILTEIRAKDDPSLDYETRFFNFWDNLKTLFLEQRGCQRFLEQFMSSPYNTQRLQQKPDNWHTWTCEFFQEGIDSGALRAMNPAVLSIMVQGSIISLVRVLIYFKDRPGASSPDLDQISLMVWDGIRNQS